MGIFPGICYLFDKIIVFRVCQSLIISPPLFLLLSFTLPLVCQGLSVLHPLFSCLVFFLLIETYPSCFVFHLFDMLLIFSIFSLELPLLVGLWVLVHHELIFQAIHLWVMRLVAFQDVVDSSPVRIVVPVVVSVTVIVIHMTRSMGVEIGAIWAREPFRLYSYGQD